MYGEVSKLWISLLCSDLHSSVRFTKWPDTVGFCIPTESQNINENFSLNIAPALVQGHKEDKNIMTLWKMSANKWTLA
jgi:hypothetical protein